MTGSLWKGSENPAEPHPTFCMVLVQLVGGLLPVFDALLQRIDETLQQRAVGESSGSGLGGCARARVASLG